jgi:8-oxo-dGTP pyrophosphatase MutT (NUDIX family)
MLMFHAVGDWGQGDVRLKWTPQSTRRVVPAVERIINETWDRVANKQGVHLFDGPMCRVESFEASSDVLRLTLSPTSYKPFLGTNLHNPQLAEQYGRDVLANPVGVSTVLETSDGFLMLGRRNASVAYYPDRVHPFAGALEPHDGADPFSAVYRELREELALEPADVAGLRCTGLAEDTRLLHVEMIFATRTQFSRTEIERRVDEVEHHAAWSVAADADAIEHAVADRVLTPVAVASLLLWGRLRVGREWFDRVRAQI